MKRLCAILIVSTLFLAAIVASITLTSVTSEEGRTRFFVPPEESVLPVWNQGDFWLYDCSFQSKFAGWADKVWQGHINYTVQSTSETKNTYDCYRLSMSSQDQSPGDPIISGRMYIRKSDLATIAMNWTESGIDGTTPYTHIHEISFGSVDNYDFYQFPIKSEFTEKWWVNTTMYQDISAQYGITHTNIARGDPVKLYVEQMGWTTEVPNVQGNYTGQWCDGNEQASAPDIDSRYWSPDLKNFVYRSFQHYFNDSGYWKGSQKFLSSNYKQQETNEPPEVTNPQAIPDTVDNDDTDNSVLRVEVTDDSGLADTDPVTIDLTPIGYDANTVMTKDPNPLFPNRYYVDTTVKEDTYTDTYHLYVTARDNHGAVNNSVYVTLSVRSANNPPQVSNAHADPASIPNNGLDSTLLMANVTDPEGNLNNVTVDLSPLGGSPIQPLYDDGSHGDIEAADSIYSLQLVADQDTNPGTYPLYLYVDDDLGAYNDTETIYLDITDFKNNKPKASGSKADPSAVPNNGQDKTLLTITITDEDDDPITATIDLSQIGGNAAQMMYDDGTYGDIIAGDTVFTFQTTISTDTVPEQYSLPITISDPYESIFSNIKLTVVDANNTNNPPVINYARTDPETALNDGEEWVWVLAEVTDPDSGQVLNVTVDLTSLGGSPMEPLLDDGQDGDEIAGDSVFSTVFILALGTSPGQYVLPVTATDNGIPAKSATANALLNVEDHKEANFPPEISYIVINPLKVTSTNRNVTVSAFAFDREGDGFQVFADLSSIGGSNNQELMDDGLNGDVIAGDDTYSYKIEVPMDQSNGNYTIFFWVEQNGLRIGLGLEDKLQVAYTIPSDPVGDDDDDDDKKEDKKSVWENMPIIILLFALLGVIIVFLVIAFRKPKGNSGDEDGEGVEDEDKPQAMVRI